MLLRIFLLFVMAASLSSTRIGMVVNADKELVIFAGPHKTSETSIEEFFYSYAVGSNARVKEQEALSDWVWPQIKSPYLHKLATQPHQIYGHLVTDVDDVNLQKIILDSISKHWEAKLYTKGLIMGSEEFDHVGKNPNTHYDAISAIQRVVGRSEVSNEDVTMVLLYKTPRLQQWLSIYNYVTIEVEQDSKWNSYDEFVCDPYATDARWEALDTAMNPLRTAMKFREQGWKVVLIDMGGVDYAGIDVEHVIGCEVLGGSCKDGWLDGLRGVTFDGKMVDSWRPDEIFDGLSQTQQDDLEQLLRWRDCSYERLAMDDGVKIQYEDTIFEHCGDAPAGVSELLVETDFLLDVIRSQVDCADNPIPIQELLSGEIHELDYYYPKTKKEHRPSWTMPVFLLVFVAAGAVGLVWIQRGASTRHTDEFEDVPTTEFHGRGGRPLSAIM